MPQTFYVTQDEEILSIVGKLRSSELLESVFVVPKRALVLQSIVNLRMLFREAEKAGKRVVIVTSDENGRRLAEKAGIETRPYSEDAVREPEPVIRELPVEEMPEHHAGPPADSIGSSAFYATPEESLPYPRPEVEEALAPTGQRIRVRNSSPVRLPSLNSVRSAAPIPTVETHVPHDPPRSDVPSYEPVERFGVPDARVPDGRLSRVFSSSGTSESPIAPNVPERPKRPARERKPSRNEPDTRIEGKGGILFPFFVTISILFLLGTGAFILLPKADIVVTPNSVSQDLEMEFGGTTDSSFSGDNTVPVRIIEKEGDVTVTGTASGSSTGNGSKATGKILIYNAYGPDAQQLVATTRFQGTDGKIFRLTKGVTVPGSSVKNGQSAPGVVEADVVADEVGSTYDIGPSDFSIPGFAGGSKAGKIYGKSTSSMTGGSSVGSGGSSAVSASDLERVKKDALEQFRRSFADSLGQQIASNERYIQDTFEISVIGNPSVPAVGSLASTFEYKATYHGKAFVFSEDELRARAAAILRKSLMIGDPYVTKDVAFRYEGGTADFKALTIHFKAGVSAVFVASVDSVSLRNDFLGKNSDEIKQALTKHPEVRDVEIDLSPKGLTFSVPKDPKRVSVTVSEP
ncbi:MAG TPA: hypothetical protein VN420_03215 [Candidatus Fimivivens sp.]|nr:hypothetical protein [Candidatus Fimivivens sp.]